MRRQNATTASSGTVKYPPTGSGKVSHKPSTLGPQIPTVASTIRAQPLSRQVVGDRGQPLVGIQRVGPIRQYDSSRPPIGSDKNYKTPFKTPGFTEQKKNVCVDVAHCKNMKGRFEHAFDVPSAADSCQPRSVYGCISGSQFGKVERPSSASRMLGFRNVCRESPSERPSSANMRKDAAYQGNVSLDNVLVRAGI
ncbi:hypothetical protein GUITHDRAFT_161145 [Guillardia theta CCMP2712]|uniref:Uncharacterized protein n=1 Tax=Guillardia theta (strain CCMP2712) TaxID=905079 RepID=L1JY61_GUITC|nr:hypothetical protein GUITHDRAFT_161145 [Guillardia theta CCMP2712]EKX53043.1 hypothetical protein GUITHDRAFT_161145 [Guillardia theta CCMP2712]|mmetsp:Transcript_18387/g.60386  ORF Transcript_18387/g.60386 Transcript_18387/m.60386 type:complete len:195 (-) Transcript_18387:272-856(-)|eukprot:XP_005840023.1 hypothetical protein GUITHDRAFT_161145 [Guillardia theta CCMP2712]